MNVQKWWGLLALWGLSLPAQSQSWVKLMYDSKANFYDVQAAFEQQWGNQPYKRGNGWKQFKRWEAFMEPRVYPSGHRLPSYKAWEEHQAFRRTYPNPAGFRAGNWTSLGPDAWQTVSYNPGNGRINAVLQDPNNSNTLYVGAPSGGCWKSTNGGNSWTVLTDNLPILGVSAMAVPDGDPNTVYIGTGDGDASDTYSIGVLKSTDGGTTWNNTGLTWTTSNNRLIRRMVIHPTNPNTLWVASNIGMFKTTDGGATWTQTLNGENMYDVEIKPGDPSTLYAASNEFYKSTDGGNSWTLITTGTPAAVDVNRISIDVTAANPNYVYLLAGSDADASFLGLYRSNNSGTSFALRSNSPNIFSYAEDGNDTGGQSWYDIALAISPTNAEEVYAGGINVWKSTNGGTDWTISTHWYYPPTVGYVHADIHTLIFFGNTLYCGSDGGIFKTTNGGSVWTDLSPGIEIMQFYRFGGTPQNANLLIGGAQDNGTNRYVNGQWTHVIGADGMEAAIDYTNPQIMYGTTQNGGLNRSMDGGQNFSDISGGINDAGAWVTPYVIDPVNPQVLYAGYGELWKTTNRGNSWTQISNFNHAANLRSVAVAPSNNQYIYTATYTQMYKSTNGGNNWTTITNNLPNNAITYIAIHPTDPNTVWVTLSGFSAGNKVFKTTNGGTSWTNVSGNLPNLPVNCIAYQTGTNDGIYVGTDVGIYYRDNTLANWVSFMDGLPNVIVNELEIHYGVNKIRAATYGRGVWESDLYTPSTLPPTANFTAIASNLCVGDSVKFQDLSVNAMPGWNWSFPGGSPATSTAQSPSVYYATAGSYTATLIVQNANGYDTLTQQVQVDFATNTLAIEITTDNYPEETSWDIVDGNGTIVASGSGYAAQEQTYTTDICLSDGCYTFTIYDAYGDGICCAYGNGSYNLLDDAQQSLGSGGSFTSSESVVFCFNATAPLQITSVGGTVAGCGVASGSITVSVSGGDGNYEYSINGGAFQTSNTFTNLNAGTYNIVVQDGSGNTANYVATVPQAMNPVAMASSNVTTVTLNQGSATVNFFSTGSTMGSALLWNFGDGTATSSQATVAHTFTAAGTYAVVLSATVNGCVGRDTVWITVQVQSSAGQPEPVQPSVRVVPNPVTEQFTLQVDLAGQASSSELFIYNALGQLVFWESMPQGALLQVPVHFGNQPAGVYTVVVKTERFAIAERFVKG